MHCEEEQAVRNLDKDVYLDPTRRCYFSDLTFNEQSLLRQISMLTYLAFESYERRFLMTFKKILVIFLRGIHYFEYLEVHCTL